MTSAFTVQARVIGALVLRETRTRFGDSQLGYLWAIVEPASHVAILAAIFSVMSRTPPMGNSMAVFFATGILPFFLYRNISNHVTSAISGNRQLLTYPIVQQVDAMIARAMLEFATAILVMIFALFILIAIGEGVLPARPVSIAGALLGLTMFGFGIGVFNAVVIEIFPSWKHVFALISRPLYFISGIFFSVETMPPKIQEILLWNPILHGVEWLRYGYYFNHRGASFDPGYLLLWGLGMTLFGLMVERVHRRWGIQ